MDLLNSILNPLLLLAQRNFRSSASECASYSPWFSWPPGGDGRSSIPSCYRTVLSKGPGNTRMVLHSHWANMSTSEASNYRLRRGPFIVPAVLGWGNNFHLLDALDRNRAALKMYVEKEAKFTRGKNRPPSPVQDYIRDTGFWNDLDDILCLLQPICQQQKISESGDSTLQMVYPRWLGIETHLTSQIPRSRFGPALRDYLQDQFRSRWEIYVASVHKEAYFLDPLNSGKALDPIDLAEVLTFLKKSTSESQQSLVEKKFDRFRAREFEFDRPDL